LLYLCREKYTKQMVLRNTLFTLLQLFISLYAVPLFAQDKIVGRVVERYSQEPLPGAQVVLEGGQSGTTTRPDGSFELEGGQWPAVILVKYLGYQTQRMTVRREAADVGTIAMPVANTTLDEVVVSASPRNFKQSFKGSNYRIDPKSLEQINPLSTEEVLRTVPGVNIVGDMGLSNRPNISIRGSWGRRSKKVLLLEDGSPAAPAPYIAPGAYYNPVSDRLTSIEVYKGADLLRFGPNNMYGAVNYITALPPQQPELRAKLVGGQRNYQTGLLSYGGTWNKLGALVEGVYKRFDGFIDNSSVEVLNLNAKIFAQLSDKQSLYFKVSAQSEDNQASLSSQTPFTFEADPTQNPLDADQFTMRRYGVDIIHKWLLSDRVSLSSKIYASDFERDWWRQITAKVKAADVRSYVGEQIFQSRYGYLQGRSFGPKDYVIVGRVQNGRESTTDSRWRYTVTGLKETLNVDWDALGGHHQLEAGFNLHREIFSDRFLVADSSRWARSGRTTKDLWYRLWSANGYVRNAFSFGSWSITPILRFEYIDMYRQDRLSLAQQPGVSGTDEGREPNAYHQFLPGLTVDYQLKRGELYGSVYQGMIAPSKVFGFLVERNGVVTNPLAGQAINIAPELSWNTEIGWRGGLLQGRLDGQLTYFNNTSCNFYAGGRNEVFRQLGKIHVQGLETALQSKVIEQNDFQLRLLANLTYMQSTVLSGQLEDRDLFSQVVHSSDTRQEYLAKVNANRNAFEVYVEGTDGELALLTDEVLSNSDFELIRSSVLQFGDKGIEDASAPYVPNWNTTVGFEASFRKLSFGMMGHYVSEQFTEFHNFEAESADGAIGQLPAYFTVDANLNYRFDIEEKVLFHAFVNGKNITNDIYRASRLNRATSGVFAGGFRQVVAGVNVRL